MTISMTQNAIEYYRLAIENAKKALEDEINIDFDFIKFKKKYQEKLGHSTLFFSHIQEFGFYNCKNSESECFFNIVNNEIIYDKNNTFKGVEDVANELLNIVKRFY